jgi:hypothetical protein
MSRIQLLFATLALGACGVLSGCVGASESEAWADDEPQGRPVEWEGEERDEPRQRRVSSASPGSPGPGDPDFARPGPRRRVASGKGWRVTSRGGQPVETFASAEGPVGFEPSDPRQAPAQRVVTEDPPGPWLTVPSQAPGPLGEDPSTERTPLRLKAEGVELVSGECGPVPVARYGLDWRPAREWRVGQDENPEPWLRPVPPLPLPPAPKPNEGEVLEAEAPAGSWYEAR